MTEPAATIGAAIAAGAGASVLASFGLESAPIFWAVVGAALGMSFAAASSRSRAAAVFVAVVLACSLFGAWLAQRYLGGEPLSRNAFACGLAIFFHPLLQAAITRLPAALDGVMRKFGIGAQP